MIRIRQAHMDSMLDRERLMRLQFECLPTDDPLDVDTDDTPLWWLALDGNLAVAFGALSGNHNDDPLAGYLSRCGVVESHRGMGLQRRLIRARIKKARELGLSSIHSDTIYNPHSVKNLMDCGLVQVGFNENFQQQLWRASLL